MKPELLAMLFWGHILTGYIADIPLHAADESAIALTQWKRVLSGSVPETLKLICYNIQSRPFLDDARGKASHVSKAVSPYDLVALQETFVGNECIGPEEFSAKAYFNQRRHDLKIANSGLAILSRFPIDSTLGLYFTDEGSFENQLASKGVLMVRIAFADAVLDLYTTHLAAGTEKVSGKARKQAASQIIELILQHSPEDHAVILCGDFNLQSRNPANAATLQRFTDECQLRNAATSEMLRKHNPIDHVFFRRGKNLPISVRSWAFLQFHDPAGKPLSDHAPLVVEFALQ